MGKLKRWIDRTTSWITRRDNADVLPPGDVRPIVVVMSANTGVELEELGREVDAVTNALVKSREFNVYRSKGMTWPELQQVLQTPAYQGRFAMLHFAGHADEEGIILEGDNPDGQHVDARSLLAFLREQGMTFVFLNGCVTREIAPIIGRDIPNLALVVTTEEILDGVAKVLAEKFYKVTLSRSPLTLSTAYAQVTSGLESTLGEPRAARRSGRGPGDPYASVVVTAEEEGADWPWRLIDPLPHANLADRAYLETREPETDDVDGGIIVRYCVIIYLIGLISLAVAYFGVTSPAFRGAFCYATTKEHVLDLGTRHVLKGFFIEALRQLMLVSFLGYVAWRWRGRPLGAPRFWPLRRKWFMYPPNFITTLVAVIVTVYVTQYHVWSAPSDLQNKDEMWKLIRESSVLQDVWMSAWGEDARPLSEIKNPDDTLWRELYLYPYLVYYPYSLVNFLFIAVPLFHTFLTGIVHRFNIARSWSCRGMLAAVRALTNTGEIVARIDETFRRCQKDINDQMLLVLLFALIACTEPTWGYLTLAKVASMITLVTFLFVVATLAMAGLLGAVYGRRVNEALAFSGRALGNPKAVGARGVDYGVVRAELRRRSVGAMLSSRGTLVTGGALFVALVYIIWSWSAIV